MIESGTLRALTYLAPGLPIELFEVLTAELAAAVGARAGLLRSEPVRSGPRLGEDPFTRGEADVAFMCAPSYVRLARSEPSPAVLVPAGAVFVDERNGGRAVYFTDVVVRRDGAAHTVADLAGARWGYNDDCSLSGFDCIVHELGADRGRRLQATGSHEASVDAVLAGTVDVAPIDANVLARLVRADPSLPSRLRLITSWGPYPVQPVVASSRLEPAVVRAMADRLLALEAGLLEPYGVRRFVAVTAADVIEPLSWLV